MHRRRRRRDFTDDRAASNRSILTRTEEQETTTSDAGGRAHTSSRAGGGDRTGMSSRERAGAAWSWGPRRPTLSCLFHLPLIPLPKVRTLGRWGQQPPFVTTPGSMEDRAWAAPVQAVVTAAACRVTPSQQQAPAAACYGGSNLQAEGRGTSHPASDLASRFSRCLNPALHGSGTLAPGEDLVFLHGQELAPLFIQDETQRASQFPRINPTDLVCAGTNLALRGCFWLLGFKTNELIQ